MKISLTINGKKIEVEDAAEQPLLYFLRGDLGLTRTRYGCGSGSCGSCMVIVDGSAVQSCDMPLSAAHGSSIETAEALNQEDIVHPILKALNQLQAAQCGYCISGITMSAKALLDKNIKPTRAEIVEALDFNLCRCGAHLRIIDAIDLAASEMRGDS